MSRTIYQDSQVDTPTPEGRNFSSHASSYVLLFVQKSLLKKLRGFLVSPANLLQAHVDTRQMKK